jgi:hypothetical protein
MLCQVTVGTILMADWWPLTNLEYARKCLVAKAMFL